MGLQHDIVPVMTSTPTHSHATAADLAGLERHEVVGGALVEKAAPAGEHATSQFRLARSLGHFDGPPAGDDHPGGWWFGIEAEIELGAHEVYLPDMAGWRIERMPEPPRGRPIRVAPDWVCEILSPSTTGRDLGHKLRAYHLARVSQYWVLDPANQALTVYRWQETGYAPILAADAGEVVRAQPFDAIELDTGYVFLLPPNRS